MRRRTMRSGIANMSLQTLRGVHQRIRTSAWVQQLYKELFLFVEHIFSSKISC
jgi:hypothetical protein